MRVIGVVDLLAGRAVHARAGRRESYAPVRKRRRYRHSIPATRSLSRGRTWIISASASCTSPTSTPFSGAVLQQAIVAALVAAGGADSGWMPA